MTRRSPGEGTVYQRDDGKWVAEVSLPNDHLGRRRRRKRIATTRREAERLLAVLDKRLEGREYVTGEYSIADMAIYPWLRQRIERFEGFTNVERWVRTVADRPATISAYEKGAAINTVPTITEESKALLLGIASDQAA